MKTALATFSVYAAWVLFCVFKLDTVRTPDAVVGWAALGFLSAVVGGAVVSLFVHRAVIR